MRLYFSFFIFIALTQFSIAQNNIPVNSIDSIETGKEYKVTLFSGKEIIGTVVSQDTKSISIKENNIVMTIKRNNILRISTDIKISKYKFLATLNTGFIPNNFNGDYGKNFIINGRFSYFISENINAGVDISYTSFENNDLYLLDFNGISSGRKGGNSYYFDFLANAQIGTFDKNSFIDLYVNLGLGFLINHRNSSGFIYYPIYDTNYFEYNYYRQSNSSYTDFYALFQVGCGMIMKPSDNFGINMEFDIKAYGFEYFIYPSQVYFPLKVGISYYFMK